MALLSGSVCKNVWVEPDLIPVSNDTFRLKRKNTEKDATLDIMANSFYRPGQTDFFDFRVVHVSYIWAGWKWEKANLIQPNFNIEHGTFTPLIFWTNGGTGKEASDFIRLLESKISEKIGEPYAIISSWLRTKLSFKILKIALLCVRGSRTIYEKSNCEDYALDFWLNSYESDI